MKYLKRFNEGIFSTYSNDQEIADMIYQLLLYEVYDVIEHNGIFTAVDIKLDEYIGTYNISSKQSMLLLEYYKLGKLAFKKELNCSISTMVDIYNLLKQKV
jgi:LytS/YehU family sensor histidine kinase